MVFSIVLWMNLNFRTAIAFKLEVGRCRLTESKPVLKAPMLWFLALETKVS